MEDLDSKLQKNVTDWRIQEFAQSNYTQAQNDQAAKAKTDYELAKEEREKNQEKEPTNRKVKNRFLKMLETQQDPLSMQFASDA